MTPIIPTNTNNAGKIGLALAATVALTLPVAIWSVLRHTPAQPAVIAPAAADAGLTESLTCCSIPTYLKELLPPYVHGLAVEDVGPAEGGYKMVVWSRWPENTPGAGPSTSQILLVSTKGGQKAHLVWKSDEEEGYYAQKIRVIPDWKHKGHQVFVVMRQSGAAAVTCRPVWVNKKSLQMLPDVAAERVEISELNKSHKHKLVCYARIGPNLDDKPEVFLWNGNQFAN